MKQDIIEQIKSQIEYEYARSDYPENFPTLPLIPGERYIDKDFYDLEMQQYWTKSWLCVLREEELPSAGCYKIVDKIDRPVIVVRGKDNTIRAFFNTCRHRGVPLVIEDGKRNLFTCRYHSWSYDLQGDLVSVPEQHDFGNFDKCTKGLLPVKCEIWGGWVFINFDNDAEPLTNFLGSVADDLDSLDMANLRLKGKLTYTINCNWKAAFDAFLEAYHVNSIHQDTVAQLLDIKGTAIGLYKNGHSRMAMPKKFNTEGGTWGTDAEKYDIASVPKIFRENNLAYGISPNFVSPFDSGGFPFILFWPDGKDSCIIEVIAVGAGDEHENADNSEYWQTFMQNYDLIMQEDLQFLESIQRSLESGAFKGMTLCYQERRIYWLHEEIDRRIGLDNIPENLRVAQVLEPFTVD